ncbi:MAG: PD-(D/E)XK nuclease family protein [Legionellaceae bacterium]|nr:PD-(D/E)XK nuclease family protein [Legionellaceae bacterium]
MFEFLQALPKDTWVITPNRRLSQHLQTLWANQYAASILCLPRFIPYPELLNALYQCLREQDYQNPHPQPLNQFQFYALMTQVVEHQYPQWFNANLVHHLIDTWNRCENWAIAIEEPLFSTTRQTQLFYQCAQQIKQELRSLAAISQAEIAGYLLQLQHQLTPPFHSLICYGFDDWSPRQTQVLDWLKRAGVQVYQRDIQSSPAPRLLLTARDEQEEQAQCLAWLKAKHHPDRQLAVVIPDLTDKADAFSRLMLRHFPAEQCNISLGKPLLDYPITGQALCGLGLHRHSIINKREMHLLLLSPFIGDNSEEMTARSSLLESEPFMRHRQMTLSVFIALCRPKAPKLAQRLTALTEFPEQASPYQWAQYFDERLTAMGFPGDSALNSTAYQTYQRLSEALNDFRSLSLIQRQYTHAEALQSLRQLLQQIIFQPQASPQACIHLYGLLEAEGIPFDGIWISGLSDTVLPQAVRYSPFIPIPLQQQHQMPHASMERERKLAHIIIDRFHRASPEVICSYPANSGDRPNLVSPILCDAAAYAGAALPHSERQHLDRWSEQYAIALTREESLRGGSAILAQQAKCPFKAFAKYRLGCNPPIPTQESIESRDQGTLIHRIMELIWKKLQSQAALIACSDSQKHQLVHDACQQALAEFKRQHNGTDSEFSLAIEQQRLSQLALSCLQQDEQRPPFTVHSLESVHHYPIGEQQIRLKIDRLDMDETGSKWLIDYKSSIPSPLPWNQERPEEPQLLLYALIDEHIHTLSYLQLKTVQVSYKGLSTTNHAISGISLPKPSWQECRQQWQVAIQNLQQEFAQGYCPPQPIKDSICSSCEYSGLCRFKMQPVEDECTL